MSMGDGKRAVVLLCLIISWCWTTTSHCNNHGIVVAAAAAALMNALENEEEANNDEQTLLFGTGNEPPMTVGEVVFDETDWIQYDDTAPVLLVEQVLDVNSNSREEEEEEKKEDEDKKSWKRSTEDENNYYDHQQSSYYSDNVSSIDDDVMATAVQQFKRTSNRLVQKYYTPLPKQGKGALGGVIGYTISRFVLGVANRTFRIVGATYVLSEALYTSGFCDEEKCSVIPEEARPWITIVRRLVIRQCIKVRHVTRQLWDTEKIRHVAQQDEVLSGGFAVGAFIGFVV